MDRFLYIVGIVWFSLVGLAVLIGALGILLFQGIWRFWEIFSPFNIWNWGLIFVLCLPGFGLWWLSAKIAERKSKKLVI